MKNKIILGIVIVIIIGIFFYKPISIIFTTEYISIKVNKTDIKRNKEKDLYLVYTDEETFKNEDSFWNFKYNSSDLHGKLKQDSTYKVEVNGYRIPYFSIYRNIVDIEFE